MFDAECLYFYDIRPSTLNVYILVDPAGSKKKGSDDTAMAVIGMDTQRVKWFLGGYSHKMGLTERWKRMKILRKQWLESPGVQQVFVGYESYAIPDALHYFEERMEIEQDPFPITVLQWPRQELGSKSDRISRLEPDIRGRKFVMAMELEEPSPRQLEMKARGKDHLIFKPAFQKDHEGRVYSVNGKLIQQIRDYPYSQHDDLLDACSRIYDMDEVPPVIIERRMLEPEVFVDGA